MRDVGRFRTDPYGALRKRMIQETEVALAVGLLHPSRVPRIPTVEVGHGTFHPDFAAEFWQEALGLDSSEQPESAGRKTPDRPRNQRFRMNDRFGGRPLPD